jgi:hypothetical protein
MESLRALRTKGINTQFITKNEYFVSIVTLLALAYVGSVTTPKLPKNVSSVVDNIVVKFVVFFVVAYAISRKVDVALIASLAVLALVLGVQVYLTDKPKSKSVKEPMIGGFQKVLGTRQADVTIDKAGKYMENEPLNETWTKTPGKGEGYSLDWPGYESIVDKEPEVESASKDTTRSSNSNNSSVMALNETKDVPKDGEIVGMVNTDLSNMETV